MLQRFFLTGAVVAVAALAVPAGAETVHPLRTLVYDVNYTAEVVRHEQTSGFNGSGIGNIAAGHGAVDRRFGSDDQGRLTIEIVAATPDGGLVADVSYAGKIAQPRTRVAIFKDGRLSFDPAMPLAPPALRVVPFLARGFVAERDLSPGASWQAEAPAPAVGNLSFRVAHADATVATIEFEGSMVVRGSNGFAETERGSTLYAVDTLAPVQLDFRTTTRRELGTEQSDTTDAHVVAHVVSDSFAKR